MRTYHRTTRECSVAQLHPELRQAIRGYFVEHKLGDLESEVLLCYETISRQKSSSRLISWLKSEMDATIYMGMLLTSQWLIWVRRGDQTGTVLTAANLKEIQVRVFRSMFTKDVGLEIFGPIGPSKDHVRGYIGMESELAAQRFYEETQKAIDKVKPLVKKGKGISRWWSG